MKKRGRLLLFCLAALWMAASLMWETTSVSAAVSKEQKMDILKMTGLASDAKGKLKTGTGKVTRGEFASMLIQASPYKKEVKKAGKTKLFKDVSTKSAYAPYIYLAVNKGYMSGYKNGSFRPNKGISLRDAIYGVVTMLGYGNGKLSGNLPQARYTKYKELGLNKNIKKAQKSILNRNDCNNLFFNLLSAAREDGKLYGEVLGCPLDDKGKVDYESLLESKMKGPLLVGEGWEKELPYALSSFAVYKEGRLVSADWLKPCDVVYYVKALKRMWIYDKKICGTLDAYTAENGKISSITVSGKSYQVGDGKRMQKQITENGLSEGKLAVLLLGRNQKASGIYPVGSVGAADGWKAELPFLVDNARIYRNGKEIAASDIESFDTLYYSAELRTIWDYHDKVYGVLSKIAPNKTSPETLTIAGTDYSLAGTPAGKKESQTLLKGSQWAEFLAEQKIQEGDPVVLSLGYGGLPAGVYHMQNMNSVLIGYVIDKTASMDKDAAGGFSIQDVIEIYDTNGIRQKFTIQNSQITKGNLVEVRFQNGRPVVTRLQPMTLNYVSGHNFIENPRIIDVSEDGCSKLSLRTLKEYNPDASRVLYYRENPSGEITDLILNNLTGIAYQYGMVKSLETEPQTGMLTAVCDIGGTEQKFITDDYDLDLSLGPKAFYIKDGELKKCHSLSESRIQYLKDKQANTGNQVFYVADDVLVYFYRNGICYSGNYEDLGDVSGHVVYGYTWNYSGPVRVIVVRS